MLFVLAVVMPFGLYAASNQPSSAPDVLLPPTPQHPGGVHGRGERPQQRFDFEQYLSQKCNAVVRELELSSQDSARFVPVYRELQQQKSQLWRKYGGGRQVRIALERGEQVPDSTLMRVVTNMARLEAEDAQIELRFVERLSQVLTPLQLYRLQQAEQKFKTEMMKRANHGNDGHRRGNPGRK